jgi:hydroxymethylpyrimidine pyrophosphatase-like HAD family hydrolase
MLAEPVAKLLARHEELTPEEFVALVEDVIGDRATVTHSSSDALAEISAVGVTKASGLAKVAARHGVGPEDVVVFGDMPNDIAAFEWVRTGGGRAVATDVTGTNEDDGVAAFLAAL